MRAHGSSGIAERIAGAPASWGICEVPGWGYQLPPRRVLADMREASLRATELGPEGFLPGGPQQQKALLASFSLKPVGAFCPLMLLDRFEALQLAVRGILDRLDVLGAGTMVIAAATPVTGYDTRPELDDGQWKTLLRNLERVSAAASQRGVTPCLHPHAGTLVETRDDVRRVLDGCDVPLCLDTGHLLVGGTDPVELARQVPERIAHVHLKDVDAAVLATVRSGERSYTDGVRSGMYTVLGRGSIDLASMIGFLETSGYTGWYVPEQDRVLTSGAGDDTLLADIQATVEFLRGSG
jgi:inosose dehydratase